jgi:hypothetical protein
VCRDRGPAARRDKDRGRSSSAASLAKQLRERKRAPGWSAFRDVLLEAVAVSCSPTRSAKSPDSHGKRDANLSRLPDAMEPGFHCVRTHWIRGFIGFQLARRTQDVMLMMPV